MIRDEINYFIIVCWGLCRHPALSAGFPPAGIKRCQLVSPFIEDPVADAVKRFIEIACTPD
jgi:hypothetical protein